MLPKTLRVSILIAIVAFILIEVFNKTKPIHPYADRPIHELIQHYEYPVEIHEVTTEDGYIITLYRIPNGKEDTSLNKIPVLLIPGIMQSASDFVSLGQNSSLSFILANKGYDVWLGSFRGTIWSRKHTVLDPDKDASYWNFSEHELGFYDVPAFIDYILKKTNQDSLHYVGYSQGSTAFFIMASEKPEYNTKIRLMSAVAPAVFMKDPGSPVLTFLANHWYRTEKTLQFFQFQEMFSRNGLFHSYVRFMCNENSIFADLCIRHIYWFFGFSEENGNDDRLSLIFSYCPTGVSRNQFIHILQIMASGTLHQYDLGPTQNLEKYGQDTPPHYDISKVTVPVALYYSSNDWAINIKNMERLSATLPNVVKQYQVQSDTFNHYDFVFAKDVVNFLYNEIVAEITKY